LLLRCNRPGKISERHFVEKAARIPMPRFTITRKIVSVARSYVAVDGDGIAAFRISGKLRFARTFAIQKPSGILLLNVRETLLALDPTYVITQDGIQVAVVRRITTSGARVDRFTIELGSEGLFDASGKLSHDIGVAVRRDGNVIARVRRTQQTLREIFEFDAPADRDHALLLAVAMSIAETDPSRGEAPGDGLHSD
jgi:uncharacterized protein YxjI